MTSTTRITSERVLLRSWRRNDGPALVRLANNRNVWRNLRDAFPHPYTTADGDRWLEQATSTDQAQRTLLAVELEGEVIGGVGVHPFSDVYRRTAEVGYWLGEPFWGRGLATEALSALTRHAFAEDAELIRLQAGVFSWNPASSRVLHKCGYLLEGVRRQAVVKDGQLLDEKIYVRFRDG